MASTSRFYEGWRTFHSVQLSFNRRFRDGLQFGFNDTITLSDVARVAPRFDHTADGQFVRRADEAQAQELLGNQTPHTHIMKGTAVWDLPDIRSSQSFWKAIGLIANDWQLSTVWTASTDGQVANDPGAYTVTAPTRMAAAT